jgi:hypothetical protein
MTMNILTPSDGDKWEVFISKLLDSLNAGPDQLGEPEVDAYLEALGSSCDNTLRKSKHILKGMGYSRGEIRGTIEYFEENGGHCDCEVVLNVVSYD